MISNFIKKNKILTLIFTILIFLVVVFIYNGFKSKKWIDLENIIELRTSKELFDETLPDEGYDV
jgi:hypothetical protein